MPISKPTVNPLEDLYTLISKGSIQRDVECRGKIWRFRSLFDEDYTWRDQFVNMSGPVSMSSSQKAPTIAIAVVAIDGTPVEQIEELNKVADSLPQAAQDMIRENPKYLIAYNLYQVLQKLPRDYIIDLFEKFLSEVEVPSRKVGEEDVKNS